MNRKVILAAPMAPFRGGVARDSTAVAKAFAEQPGAELRLFSFRRLYPRLLYPGASDRDADLTNAAGCRFSLDTLNPLTWRVPAGAGDILIIPAWTFFVAPLFGALARRARKAGAVVIMIVHNLADHEKTAWKARLVKWQMAAADAFIVHSEEMGRQLRDAGLLQPATVIPHPAYDDYPAPQGRLPRERSLELLCFGLVRHYKGVDIALRALAASGLSDVRLTIAGEIWDEAEGLRALCQRADLRDKVELIERYVSDAEAAELFARSDAVVASYRAASGSGVMALAQHYRRPAIAADLPVFEGQIQHGVNGWLFAPGDVDALAKLLRQDVSRAAASAMQDRLQPLEGDGGWSTYTATLHELGNRIASGLGGPL